MQLYKVPDMSCRNCVQKIEKSVKAVDPQAKIDCDLAKHQVAVETRALPAAVVEALAAVGYEGTLISA